MATGGEDASGKDKSAVKFHRPTEKCAEHDGMLIDTFCGSEKHRLCPDVSSILKVASGVSTSNELEDAQISTKTLKTRLDTLKDTRHDNLEDIRRLRNEALERVAMYKDELVERIEELGKKTAADIMDKYKQLEDTISGDLDELLKLIETLEDMDGKLKRCSEDETKLFVHLKICKQYVSAGEELEKTCLANFGPDMFKFATDDCMKAYLTATDALGHFVEVVEAHHVNEDLSDGNIMAVYLSDENITSSVDKNSCRITGICSLKSGELIIADTNNDSVSKFNKSYQVENRCALSSAPWGVCQTSPTEVAVTMHSDNKIQFVSVGQTLFLTRSFTLNGEGACYGIACKDGKLYVARETDGQHSDSVEVYDISGTLLQTIQNDTTGMPIFGNILNIAFSAHTSNMYVIDHDKGLLILDDSDQLVATVTDPELRGAYGVCVLPGGQRLVCGCDSNNIIQFDAEGNTVRTLIDYPVRNKNPETLHFDPDSSRLIVGLFNSDIIEVYRIVKK